MTSLGLQRFALHEAETAQRDARFARMAIEKSDAARGSLTIAEMADLGFAGLLQRATNLRFQGEQFCRTGYRTVKDPDGYKRLAGDGKAAYARGKQLERDAEQIEALAWEMKDNLVLAERRYDDGGDHSTLISQRRRAAVVACGWGDCDSCGKAFQPGERGYSKCFKCNQIESATGRVKCAICSKPHAMKFGACFTCKAEGREEAAGHIRAMVLRRDDFVCQMCGQDAKDEGITLQVDHILPCALGGSAQPWNLQALCTWCNILKGPRYTPLDELARIELMLAYDDVTRLGKYLFPDEVPVLTRHLRDELNWDGVSVPAIIARFGADVPDLGECDELDGILNIVHGLAAKPVSQIPRQNRSPDPMVALPAVNTLPDMCKGVVILSTGSRACRNGADHKIASLCMEGCS